MRGQLAAISRLVSLISAGLADKTGKGAHYFRSTRPNFLVYTRREPAGVVGAIVPWNLPLLPAVLEAGPGPGGRMHRSWPKPSDYSPASAVELAAPDGRGPGFPRPGVLKRGDRASGPRSGRPLAGFGDPSDAATEMGPLATEAAVTARCLSFFGLGHGRRRDRGRRADVGEERLGGYFSSSPTCAGPGRGRRACRWRAKEVFGAGAGRCLAVRHRGRGRSRLANDSR